MEVNKTAWQFIFLVILSLVIVVAIYPASDPDLFGMLSSGRFVAETGHPSTVDLWSHTAFGRPWFMHEWLSSLVLFCIYSVLGVNGIILFKAGLLALTFGLALYAMKLKGVSANLALVTAALALLAANYGFGERIQIFVFFFLTGLLAWIELFKQNKIKFPVYLIVVLAGIVLWANMHMTYVLGIFIVGLCLFDEIIIALKAKTWRNVWQSGIVFVSAFIISGINPYGYFYSIDTLAYYFRPEAQKLDAQIYTRILEYQPLLSPDFSREPFVTYGIIWIVFSLLGILLSLRRIRISFLIVWVLFTYWAVAYTRFLWLQVFITIIGVGFHWQGGYELIKSKTAWLPHKIKLSPKTKLMVLITLVLTGAVFYQRSGKNIWQMMGLGWKPGLYSVGGAKFLRDNINKGKVFNDFNIGGFLIWEKIPVFIDGRIGPYIESSIIQDHYKILNGNLDLLDKYHIDWQMLPFARASQAEEFTRYNRLLVSTGKWALVYWDDACVIYAKRLPEYHQVISKHEYKVNPVDPDFKLPADIFMQELERKSAWDPKQILPYVLAGNYYFNHEQLDSAENKFKTALQIDPYNAPLFNNLANVCLRRGKIEEAVNNYKKAVRYDASFGVAYCNWGFVLEALGKLKEAENKYIIATKVSKGDPWPYNRLGIIEMKLGNKDKAIQFWKSGAIIDPNSEAAENLKNVYH